MRLLLPSPALRSATIVANRHAHPAALLLAQRNYTSAGGPGSSSASSKRRAVTPFNDDGHVPWSQLSAAEKTARATQQSFNFGFIIVGVVLTVRLTPPAPSILL